MEIHTGITNAHVAVIQYHTEYDIVIAVVQKIANKVLNMKYHLFRIKLEHLIVDTEGKTSDYMEPYYTEITVMNDAYDVIKILKALVENLYCNYFIHTN